MIDHNLGRYIPAHKTMTLDRVISKLLSDTGGELLLFCSYPHERDDYLGTALMFLCGEFVVCDVNFEGEGACRFNGSYFHPDHTANAEHEARTEFAKRANRLTKGWIL